MVAGDLRQQPGERAFPVRFAELLAAPARAKANVIVELVSPLEFCERSINTEER